MIERGMSKKLEIVEAKIEKRQRKKKSDEKN
jgi:hypothetical protein